MQLETVVPVGILVDQVVVVGIAPGEPAGRAGQQAVVQDLAVVVGSVLVGGEVGTEPELLHDHRAAEGGGELACPGRGVMLPDKVVADRVHVRADEIAQPRAVGDREAGVLAADLDTPGAIPERDRLVAARSPDGVDHDLRPRGDGLAGRLATIDGHLVGDQPAAHRGVPAEPAHHLPGEPCLPGDHPDVAIQIAPVAPGRIPVLSGHMADHEGGHGLHAYFGVAVEKVSEPGRQFLVDPVRLRHEVGPVEERTGDGEAVLAQHAQLTEDRLRIVVPPHQRASGARPEVSPQPVDRPPIGHDLGRISAHAERSPLEQKRAPRRDLARHGVRPLVTLACAIAGRHRVKRPTIADIARRAGVTKAAVSFALNGQPGVSAATRERILAIAEEIGFQPNSAARALSDGRAGAFGLVIDRPANLLGVEPFFMQLIAGIQAELSGDHAALLFSTAEDQAAEIAMYRSWWAQRRVDGVFLVDIQIDDHRVPVLEELRMPAVVIGTPRGAGSLTAVWQDDAAATAATVEYLVGIEAPRTLLRGKRPPTAIIYDNDVMAVSGLGAAQRMGVQVPADLSIVAWDDSPLCQLVHPPLTALSRDIADRKST